MLERIKMLKRLKTKTIYRYLKQNIQRYFETKNGISLFETPLNELFAFLLSDKFLNKAEH